MSARISRREFVAAGTAGLAAAAAGPALGQTASSSPGQAPAVVTRKPAQPVVIASGNGRKFKHGGARTCIETAVALTMKGTDVLDACIAGVNVLERAPRDTSLGCGG